VSTCRIYLKIRYACIELTRCQGAVTNSIMLYNCCWHVTCQLYICKPVVCLPPEIAKAMSCKLYMQLTSLAACRLHACVFQQQPFLQWRVNSRSRWLQTMAMQHRIRYTDRRYRDVNAYQSAMFLSRTHGHLDTDAVPAYFSSKL
jgi:hypothetical protein